MIDVRTLLFVFIGCVTPCVGVAQTVGTGGEILPNGVIVVVPRAGTPPNLVAPNTTPGGIMLVPGTVVVPGVGGTVVTGSVPLAGTVGSTGVGSFNPGLGSAAPGTGSLYPVVPFSQIPSAPINQSAMPQGVPGTGNISGGVTYGAPMCPTGAVAC